jgi:Na+-driven multidrug efflux pump
MNRSVFIGIMIILGLMVLASSLPNKFYGASDRKFIIITIATCIVSAIGLALFFSIPILTGNKF